jgi:hypothetical protein
VFVLANAVKTPPSGFRAAFLSIPSLPVLRRFDTQTRISNAPLGPVVTRVPKITGHDDALPECGDAAANPGFVAAAAEAAQLHQCAAYRQDRGATGTVATRPTALLRRTGH